MPMEVETFVQKKIARRPSYYETRHTLPFTGSRGKWGMGDEEVAFHFPHCQLTSSGEVNEDARFWIKFELVLLWNGGKTCHRQIIMI